MNQTTEAVEYIYWMGADTVMVDGCSVTKTLDFKGGHYHREDIPVGKSYTVMHGGHIVHKCYSRCALFEYLDKNYL